MEIHEKNVPTFYGRDRELGTFPSIHKTCSGQVWKFYASNRQKVGTLTPEHVNCIITHNRYASKKKDVPEGTSWTQFIIVRIWTHVDTSLKLKGYGTYFKEVLLH